ncbi:hypothetical protein JQK87_25290 [Streptomyces sp. G44]|uniref:hypothetical protein n=1 Tax=Streptomyces sp. G44 TaxID=2807632 RepID=UPI001961E5A8|nr:hypothetical protein [Streptomyces sp. G44]MBM7171658.1 hypothetical protein [Streptomyces sp. G44]
MASVMRPDDAETGRLGDAGGGAVDVPRLDLATGAGARQPGLHWLTDEAEHERALAHLTSGTGDQLTLCDRQTAG